MPHASQAPFVAAPLLGQRRLWESVRGLMAQSKATEVLGMAQMVADERRKPTADDQGGTEEELKPV